MRNIATLSESSECVSDEGRNELAKARPPRAWHACTRRAMLGLSRFVKTDDIIFVNAGTNVEGRCRDRSWIA